MEKKQVAEILDSIGTLLELKGENTFKCRAYHNASRIIAALPNELQTLIANGELEQVKGIGEGLAKKINELVTTGKLAYYEEVKSSLPPGLLEMLRIQGMGPKKTKFLYETLHITTIEELKKACEEHRLRDLDGFGEKTEQNILKGIALLATTSGKHLYSNAEEFAQRIIDILKKSKHIKRCEVAGSLRRKKEIVGDIDIIVEAEDAYRTEIMDVFTNTTDVSEIVAKGETKSSVLLSAGIQCDLRIVDSSQFCFALNYFTGSKDHNVRIRGRANAQGLSLNEYGFSLSEKQTSKRKRKAVPHCRSEADIYKSLGLQYIPPELREDNGEIEAADEGVIPKLVEAKELRGAFHCHTNYSDGMNTLKEMVEEAKKLGWNYIGIADHSKAAAYAGGMDEKRVVQQLKEIDELQKTESGIRIFKGIEVDILTDGSLDFSDKVLSSFDYVVAAIHSKFTMTKSEATKRIGKALKNKYVTMLAHPTGRLLLSREGYPVDMHAILDMAADYGTMMEINSHPLRLDIDWRFIKYGKDKHLLFPINPDAHNTGELNHVGYGIGIARKGWLETKDVLNTYDVKGVTKLFNLKHSK
jgi:DNA polymerase (family 10)